MEAKINTDAASHFNFFLKAYMLSCHSVVFYSFERSHLFFFSFYLFILRGLFCEAGQRNLRDDVMIKSQKAEAKGASFGILPLSF